MTMELAALPPPQVLEDLDFEAVYQEKLEAFRLSMGDNWSAELESDPVLKLIEQAAYGASQNRARVMEVTSSSSGWSFPMPATAHSDASFQTFSWPSSTSASRMDETRLRRPKAAELM